MDYSQFSVEEFVADLSFVQWVKGEDEKLNTFWADWVKNHPEKSAQVEEARELVIMIYSVVDLPGSQPTADEISASKQHIIQRISDRQFQPSIQNKHSISRYQPLAAVVVLVIVSSFALWWYQSAFGRETYRTAYGEMTTFTLPDQTTVTLNANSVLETSSSWNKNESREVWLSGEAYFDVTHQPDDNRFIVHTEVVNIEVFGTEFNVHNRRSEAEIILAEGSVKLTSTSNQSASVSAFMQPGEMVQLKGGTFNRSQVDVEKSTSWRNNRLYFEEESLAEIAQRLEDNYGLQTKFSSPQLSQLTFTGSSPTDDLSILFIALSEALGVNVSLQENTILVQNNQP
ncbi:MAG: FecR family protein [Cyclobacteriaceae bacterium]